MTKNRSMKIAVLVLALALITACFVGTTFAKYTSTGSANSTGVQVAKWEFTGYDVTNNTFAFDLFDTINGYDTGDDATQDEVDVADYRIAPGTSGAATLTITNSSEVDATLAFALDVSAFDFITPLEFTYKIGDEELTDETMSKLAAIDLPMGETATITVEWAWPFGGDDTSLGIAAIEDGDVDLVAKADVTLTQVN